MFWLRVCFYVIVELDYSNGWKLKMDILNQIYYFKFASEGLAFYFFFLIQRNPLYLNLLKK